MSHPRPLTGLKVLDLTRVYSGPYASLLLSDLGAEVIKVEHPEGGDDSRAFGPTLGETNGYFETLNRGKRSIAVDYRTSAGQELLRRLAAEADVLLENFRPGQMARYGLDYESLCATCPRLIYVSLSGFGQTGPEARRGCYDIVAQAESGLMSLTGFPELPLKTGPALADALTGRGAYLDIAMVDSVFACLENTLAEYTITGKGPARQGNADTALAPFDCFQATDGWVVIGIGNDRLWRMLARLIDPHLEHDPRFATNASRLAHYAALRPILAGWCRAQSAPNLLKVLLCAGVPAGSVRALDELASDRRLKARGMLAELKLDDGTTFTVPGSPIQIREAQAVCLRRGPRLGEHTYPVLSDWLQLDLAEVDRLAAARVIG